MEMVRPHCFDAVFLCFDVQDRLSMRNIVTWVCAMPDRCWRPSLLDGENLEGRH